MNSGLSTEQLIVVAALSAGFALVGTVIGIILRDYFISRSIESWKQRKALDQLYQKFRDPLLLSARELCTRLIEILDEYPIYYLKKNVLDLNPEQLQPSHLVDNSTNDPYFQRYKLMSTVYRFSSFLGWLELYRQEIVFLNSGNNKHWRKLEDTLAEIRSDLADGDRNTNENYLEWKDYLIFREEIRAIGELMLDSRNVSRTVIGYGKFCELFDAKETICSNHWISVILNFILDLEEKLDFRKNRLTLLMVHLINLMELLDNNKLEQRFLNARTKYMHASVNGIQ